MARIAVESMAKDVERASSGPTGRAGWLKGGPRLLGLGRVNAAHPRPAFDEAQVEERPHHPQYEHVLRDPVRVTPGDDRHRTPDS